MSVHLVSQPLHSHTLCLMTRIHRTTLMVTCVLLVLSLAASSPLPSIDVSQHAMTQFIATWRSTQHGGPAVISSEEQLTAAQPFVTPVLHGGLGHVLFQIAGAHVLAKRHNVTCVIAWCHQQQATNEYKPFGGRGEPLPGITLKHMFPAISYVDIEPQTRPESLRGGSTEDRRYGDITDLCILPFVCAHAGCSQWRPANTTAELLERPYIDHDFFHTDCSMQ